MVDKFRIETSVHLLRHKLNNPAEVIFVSNDDDDVKILEETFSYDNCIFKAALRGEEEIHELSIPSLMGETGPFDAGFELPDDGANKLGSNVKETGNPMAEDSNIQDADPKKPKSNVDETGNPKAEDINIPDADPNKPESNVDEKETDNTMAGDSKTKASKVKAMYSRKGRKKIPQQQPMQLEDSSAVMQSRSERQLKPRTDFSELHDRRIRPYIVFEDLENAYKLAIDWYVSRNLMIVFL